MSTCLREMLAKKLRKIYDDDDFVFCTMTINGNDRNHFKMLSFIEKAEELGDAVLPGDIVALSLVLAEEQ